MEQYNQLRERGLSDESAQVVVVAVRETERKARERQQQRDEWERRVSALEAAFLPAARYWLHVNGAGVWTEADAERRARELAEQAVHGRQPAHLGDASPRQIAERTTQAARLLPWLRSRRGE